MNHNFKPGDLALIVSCYEPSNVGKCVELVELVPAGGSYWAGKFLIENGCGEPVWHVVGDVISVFGDGDVAVGHAQKAPFRLMPLRGDFQPERQKESEVPA